MKSIIIVFLIVYNLYITYICYVVRKEILRLIQEDQRGRRVSLLHLRRIVTPW